MEEEVKTPVTEEAVSAVPEGSEAQTAAVSATSAEKPADEGPQTMAEAEAELNASFRQLNVGDVVEGTVTEVGDDRIYVDLSYYTDGVVYVEDISDDPSYSVRANLKTGDPVKATVTRKDDHGHVRLSMKEAAGMAAWERLKGLLESKEGITVKISGVTKAGCIAYVDGIRGFIPASKLSLGFVADDDLPNWIGKEIEVRVITAEEKGRKLVLSAKDILREKKDEERRESMAAVKVGSLVEGTVESIKDYGAFVNIGGGVTGLLHVSQISAKRIKTPADVLQVGQTVKVRVTKVADGRVSLSMKEQESGSSAAPAESENEGDFRAYKKAQKEEQIGTGLGALLKGIKLN